MQSACAFLCASHKALQCITHSPTARCNFLGERSEIGRFPSNYLVRAKREREKKKKKREHSQALGRKMSEFGHSGGRKSICEIPRVFREFSARKNDRRQSVRAIHLKRFHSQKWLRSALNKRERERELLYHCYKIRESWLLDSAKINSLMDA